MKAERVWFSYICEKTLRITHLKIFFSMKYLSDEWMKEKFSWLMTVIISWRRLLRAEISFMWLSNTFAFYYNDKEQNMSNLDAYGI